MNFWLVLLIVAVVMLVLGIAIRAATALVWIGAIVLVVSLVMSALYRGKANR
ncbi:hypothetical protein [Georgenia alba]|uniref:DUF2207 domain-containing protein n=1 Tax=Georgenia alba TaxID=2233858 RepID=A0ABW2Q6R1_9MICO